VKKILFTTLCAVLLMSCASQRTAVVDSAIAEAKTLQGFAKDKGANVPASADSLIAKAEKQRKDDQIDAALVSADEAVLQLQISLLRQENKSMADSLEIANGSLNIIRNMLAEHRKVHK